MATVINNPRSVVTWPRSLEVVRLLQIAGQALKWAYVGWIFVNVLTWAPTVDAHGECNCPLCHPFSLSHR